MELRWHWLQKAVSEGIVDLKYIETQSQIADILTKPTPRPIFNKLRPLIMGECSIMSEELRTALARTMHANAPNVPIPKVKDTSKNLAQQQRGKGCKSNNAGDGPPKGDNEKKTEGKETEIATNNSTANTDELISPEYSSSSSDTVLLSLIHI